MDKIDYINAINNLKRKKNAVILSHFYQDPEIQDIADFVGDSLALAYEAKRSTAETIIFAGVVFMAETAKLISPKKRVFVPDLDAGCSLSDQCPPALFKDFISQYPDHLVITYINSSAAVKALSDVICTSSNVLKIVNSFPSSQKLIFGPDKNLGKYVNKVTGRDMKLWNGSCLVHEAFSAEKILQLKAENEGSEIIAHPECAEIVIEIAKHIGSTNSLIAYAKQSPAKSFIVVTESGILHQMKKEVPDKLLIAAPLEYYTSCNCGECPYMKMNSLEKVYKCLSECKNEITVEKETRIDARFALDRMFELTDL